MAGVHRTLASCLVAPALIVATGFAPATAADPEAPLPMRWETYDRGDGLPSDRVFAVLVDGSHVWAGTEQGLALLRDGTVRVWGTDEGLPFPAVTALALDPRSGDLWIGTMGGAARLSGGRLESFTQLDSGLANNVVYGLAVDGDDVWMATAAGLSRYDTRWRSWSIFDTSNTLMHEPWTYGVTTHEGAVYVAVWGGGVVVHDPDTGTFREHRDPDGEMEMDLFRDDGLVHDVTSSVSVSEGVMWVGTYFGLSRYDGRHWRSYSAEDSGLAGDFINAVLARGRTVWIATDQGLSRFDSSRWHTWRRRADGGFEMETRDGDGSTQVQDLATGFPSNTIFAIDLADGGVWLATAAGLSHGTSGR